MRGGSDGGARGNPGLCGFAFLYSPCYVAAPAVRMLAMGWEHVFAGLLYSFGPYSATFLLPSNLYLGYVLAPWLVLCTWQGLRAPDRSRWAWSAGFALLVFAGGNTDPPGVLFAGIPVLLTGAYLVGIERATPPRRALSWAAGTAALCVAVSAVSSRPCVRRATNQRTSVVSASVAKGKTGQ